MVELFSSFISKVFLRSVWELEYGAYQDSEQEKALHDRLSRWSARKGNNILDTVGPKALCCGHQEGCLSPTLPRGARCAFLR